MRRYILLNHHRTPRLTLSLPLLPPPFAAMPHCHELREFERPFDRETEKEAGAANVKPISPHATDRQRTGRERSFCGLAVCVRRERGGESRLQRITKQLSWRTSSTPPPFIRLASGIAIRPGRRAACTCFAPSQCERSFPLPPLLSSFPVSVRKLNLEPLKNRATRRRRR